MWMLILKRHWKLIGILFSIITFLGSFYFLYQDNISLEKTISKQEIVIQSKENRIVDLEKEKILIESINESNRNQKKVLKEELYESEKELEKLKQESVKNEEKGSECLTAVEPKSLNDRLREQSRERATR